MTESVTVEVRMEAKRLSDGRPVALGFKVYEGMPEAEFHKLGKCLTKSMSDVVFGRLRWEEPRPDRLPHQWEKVEDRPGWIRFSGNVKVCPNCWGPVALISNGSEGRYDYDGQSSHVCALRTPGSG